jgi:hypothetical protein
MLDSKKQYLEGELKVLTQKTDKLFFLNDLKKTLDMSYAKRVKILDETQLTGGRSRGRHQAIWKPAIV